MSDFSGAGPGNPRVSLVIPVRDEAENIEPVLAEIRAAFADRDDVEILYVDDGSTDATPQVIRGLMGQVPRVRLVQHDRSYGKAAGLRTGAAAARADIIATIDGDGQNDPADLAKLIRLFETGGEELGLAAGQRIRRNDTGFKRFQSRFANYIRRGLLKDGARDSVCGLKVFRREVFLRLPFFDGLHRFLPALIRREGLDVVFLDVVDRPRLHGQSKYGFWNRFWVGIADLLGVCWLVRRKKGTPRPVEVGPS